MYASQSLDVAALQLCLFICQSLPLSHKNKCHNASFFIRFAQNELGGDTTLQGSMLNCFLQQCFLSSRIIFLTLAWNYFILRKFAVPEVLCRIKGLNFFDLGELWENNIAKRCMHAWLAWIKVEKYMQKMDQNHNISKNYETIILFNSCLYILHVE